MRTPTISEFILMIHAIMESISMGAVWILRNDNEYYHMLFLLESWSLVFNIATARVINTAYISLPDKTTRKERYHECYRIAYNLMAYMAAIDIINLVAVVYLTHPFYDGIRFLTPSNWLISLNVVKLIVLTLGPSNVQY